MHLPTNFIQTTKLRIHVDSGKGKFTLFSIYPVRLTQHTKVNILHVDSGNGKLAQLSLVRLT